MAQPITWDIYRGTAPKYAPRMLPAGYAQQAYRCKLYDGKLKPWFKLKKIADLAKSGEVRSIYQMLDGADLRWLEWTEVVEIAPARAAGDTTQRIAFTGYGTPKATNFALATSAPPYPKSWWRLGVPAPITACTATPGAGGTGINRDRAYLVTFVHAWTDGKTEESAPSPASAIVSAKSGQTVDLTSIPRWIITPSSITRSGSTATVTIPAGYVDWFGDKDRATIAGANETEYNGTFEITRISNTQFTYTVSGTPATPATGTLTVKTNHNVTLKRIYRTVVGNAGAFFRFVAEVSESTASYSDTSTDSSIALNEAIPSYDPSSNVTWDLPPRDMHSIIDCGNGMLAGLSGNVLCFCEPDFPHAWPEAYRRTLPFDGIGLGVIGTSVIAVTAGHPVTYTGTHPAAMAEAKLTRLNHACTSKRSIASLGFAVKYASNEGLVSIAPGGGGVETNIWYDQETWARIYPSTLLAFQFNDRYFGAFESGVDGLGNKTGGSIIIDRENNIGGVGTDNRYFSGGHFDLATSRLYLVHGSEIKQWDGDMANREILNWKSGQVILPAPTNLAAAKVEAEFAYTQAEVDAINAAAAAAIAANTAILGDEDVNSALNTWAMDELELNGDDGFVDVPTTLDNPVLTFQLYIDDVLKFAKSITQSGAFAIGAEGFKSDNVAVLLSGNAIVHRAQVAQNMLSLRNK